MEIEDTFTANMSDTSSVVTDGSSVVIDHNYPLFLGAGETPGTVQIGIQLVGIENYLLWSRALKVTLLVKNKLGFIDGSVRREDYRGDLVKQWDRCNAMVISWLTSNVSANLHSRILCSSNAFRVWNDLRGRFDKVNLTRIYHLLRGICTLTQGVSPTSVYYSKIKGLWDEMDSIVVFSSCNCDESKEYVVHLRNHRLLQFLMGLNDSYSQSRSQILMMIPTPSVNQAYAMLVQDESQRAIPGMLNLGGKGTEPTTLFIAK
ncbi:uncharacterized protein [Nicotiana sylvestris]|uniref:uncharacterized protein n=1 Tax=Nicotiana sylvestris TaxID=4096 RepID=UPI00388CCBA3